MHRRSIISKGAVCVSAEVLFQKSARHKRVFSRVTDISLSNCFGDACGVSFTKNVVDGTLFCFIMGV